MTHPDMMYCHGVWGQSAVTANTRAALALLRNNKQTQYKLGDEVEQILSRTKRVQKIKFTDKLKSDQNHNNHQYGNPEVFQGEKKLW